MTTPRVYNKLVDFVESKINEVVYVMPEYTHSDIARAVIKAIQEWDMRGL